MVELAIDGLFRTEYESMRTFAERALEAAEPLGDDPLIATALGVVRARVLLHGAIAEAESHRDARPPSWTPCATTSWLARIDAAAHLAAAEIYLDRYRDAAAHAERALADRRARPGIDVPDAVPTLGTAQFMRGRFERGRRGARRRRSRPRASADIDQAKAWSLFNRSMAALFAGDVEAALRAWPRRRWSDTAEIDQSFVTGWAGVALAGGAARQPATGARRRGLLHRLGRRRGAAVDPGWLARLSASRCSRAATWRSAARDDAAGCRGGRRGHAAGVGLPMTAAWAEPGLGVGGARCR